MRLLLTFALLLLPVLAHAQDTSQRIKELKAALDKAKADKAAKKTSEPIKSSNDDVKPKPIVSAYQQTMTDCVTSNSVGVVYVGTPLRRIDTEAPMLACTVGWLPGYQAPCIVVSIPYNGSMYHKATLSADASDAAIIDAVDGRAVSQQPASPFRYSSSSAGRAGRDGDSDAAGPWLPKAQQEYVKSLWPEGVDFPDTLKFYSLPKASQRLATTNNMPSRGFHSASGVNLEFPYVGSGGMDFAERGTWRNVTGLALPVGGRIKVWVQRKPVFNGSNDQYEDAMFWAFPQRTEAFDVLLRKNADGSEHIFNVRRRAKGDDGRWDDGTQFSPDVPISAEPVLYTTPGNSRTRNVLGVSRLAFRVLEIDPLPIKRYRFKEMPSTTLAINDHGGFFPPGFKGTGMSCTKCHVTGMNSESAPYAGPELRGRDTIFSWMPTLVSSIDRDFYTPRLDYRWPIEVR